MFVACGIWCLADVSRVSPSSEQWKVVVFGQKFLYSNEVNIFRQKVVVFGQKWLYSGNVVVFGKSGCIRAKVVLIWKGGCIRAKVVAFGA